MRFSACLVLTLCSVVVCGVARAASCELRPVAQVSLHNDGLFLDSPVILNGRTASVLVDTGSEGSLVTPEGAALFGLRSDPNRVTLMHGPNGRGQLAPNVLISSLRIGALALDARSVPLGALPSVPDIHPPIVGLIGADMWRGYDVEIDVPHGRLTFWSVGLDSVMCKRPPLWNTDYATLPARRDGGRLTVTFSLDGHMGRALIDSGARSHVLSRQFAHRVGVDDAVLAHDPGGVTSGVDLNARRYAWHRFGRLTLGDGSLRDGKTDNRGGEIWPAPVLTVSDIHGDADMLLGADWFAQHDVWLSYATSQVFVAGP